MWSGHFILQKRTIFLYRKRSFFFVIAVYFLMKNVLIGVEMMATPAGTARAENPLDWARSVELVEAVPAESVRHRNGNQPLVRRTIKIEKSCTEKSIFIDFSDSPFFYDINFFEILIECHKSLQYVF